LPFRSPVTPLRDGGYRLRIGRAERDVLEALCVELRELIEDADEAVDRLYPAAYGEDAEASAEYDRLVRDSLTSGHLDVLGVVSATVHADRLDHAQVEAWCTALNDMRLVLGERLGVTEDLYERSIHPSDPRAREYSLYAWLTWLQGAVVDALAARLPGT
jgi:hypothetical protein